MYNLIEYSDNYSKTPGSFRKYYRDELHNAGIVNTESFKLKVRITGKTPALCNIKHVETAVPLRYLGNFWRTLEMSLTQCEINLFLTWWSTCVIANIRSVGPFAIADKKLYFPLVTSTLDYSKLLQKLKSMFKKKQLTGKYFNQKYW